MRTALVRLVAVATLLLLALGALAAPATAYEPLPTDTDVDYQLGGPADRPGSVGIIARDRLEEPAEGRYNICYVNGFQTQPNEKAFWKKRMGLVLKQRGKPVVDENWGEWLLDVRSAEKRQRLTAIVGRWVDKCAADGFQAVEFDNLDSFSRSHGLIQRRHTIAFAKMLVRRSHQADLAVGQKNMAGFDGTTIGFDFAVSESCARWDECGRYVDHYGDQVVMIEYNDRDFAKGCEQFGDEIAIVRRDRALSPRFTPEYC